MILAHLLSYQCSTSSCPHQDGNTYSRDSTLYPRARNMSTLLSCQRNTLLYPHLYVLKVISRCPKLPLTKKYTLSSRVSASLTPSHEYLGV